MHIQALKRKQEAAVEEHLARMTKGAEDTSKVRVTTLYQQCNDNVTIVQQQCNNSVTT
jgi:hypothetical protein